MPKFTFRLATLLRLRETDRDRRRADLAQAYRADEIIQEQEESIRREFDALEEYARRSAAAGAVDIDHLMESRRYELVLRTRAEQARKQREAVEEEIERRREVVVAADRSVRVLESLRGKQSERHDREELRRETRQMDELALLRAVREAVE